MEFLVHILITPPEGTAQHEVATRAAEEGRRAAELATQGTIRRLWRPVDGGGRWRNIGLWSAADETELREALGSLPLRPWMTIEIEGLADHPSDPILSGATSARATGSSS